MLLCHESLHTCVLSVFDMVEYVMNLLPICHMSITLDQLHSNRAIVTLRYSSSQEHLCSVSIIEKYRTLGVKVIDLKLSQSHNKRLYLMYT